VPSAAECLVGLEAIVEHEEVLKVLLVVAEQRGLLLAIVVEAAAAHAVAVAEGRGYC